VRGGLRAEVLAGGCHPARQAWPVYRDDACAGGELNRGLAERARHRTLLALATSFPPGTTVALGESVSGSVVLLRLGHGLWARPAPRDRA
jgi:hypothetical protein